MSSDSVAIDEKATSSTQNERYKFNSQVQLNYFFLTAVVLCTSTFLCFRWPFGSFGSFRSAIRGEKVYVQQRVPENRDGCVNGLSSDSTVEIIELNLQNLTHSAIAVVGVRTGCKCAVPEGIPLRIKGRSSEVIKFRVRKDTDPALIRSTTGDAIPIQIFLDDGTSLHFNLLQSQI